MVYEIVSVNEKGKPQVSGQRITVNGKVLKLRFTMPMWYRMEDEICLLDDLYTELHGKGRLKKIVPAMLEMMSGGEITKRDLQEESDPATMKAVIEEIQRVAAQSVSMKEKIQDEDEIHDKVLEDLEKKEQRAD